MPFDVTYGAQGVDVLFFGRCDGPEVLDVHERVYAHRYLEGLQYVLVDFSGVEYLDLTTADLLRVAEHDRQYLLRNPAFVLVMVAPQAPVLGLLRTHEHFMEGTTLRTHVTNTREEAIARLRAEMLEVA